MCNLPGHIVRWMLGGVLYGVLEVLYRGYTHWTMMLLAALLCIPLDIANERMPWDLPLRLQAVLGGLSAGLGVSLVRLRRHSAALHRGIHRLLGGQRLLISR